MDTSILVPIIRKHLPSSVAEEICSVQPMTEDIGRMFDIEVVTGYRKHERFGTYVHDFMRGYMIHNGKEFIPYHEFIELYPDLHYEELSNMKYGTARWTINPHWLIKQ